MLEACCAVCRRFSMFVLPPLFWFQNFNLILIPEMTVSLPQNILPHLNNETEKVPCMNTNLELLPDALPERDSDASQLDETIVQKDERNGETTRLPLYKRLSQELIVSVEKEPHVLVVTEKLPEVVIVAEQLPELLSGAENILPVHSSKVITQEPNQVENISHCRNVIDGDCVVTTNKVVRTDSYYKRFNSDEIIQNENIRKKKRGKTKYKSPLFRENHSSESCIAPFFIVVYTILSLLVIFLIFLNFWFGFDLILLIALFGVIALFILLLTEFSEYQNLII